ENLYSAAVSDCHFNAEETRGSIDPAWAERPHLTGRKRIAVDRRITVQLGRRDKLLGAIHSHRVAERAVPELAREDSLLLLFHTATHLECKTDQAFQFLVRHACGGIGEQQLYKTTHSLLYGLDIAAR